MRPPPADKFGAGHLLRENDGFSGADPNPFRNSEGISHDAGVVVILIGPKVHSIGIEVRQFPPVMVAFSKAVDGWLCHGFRDAKQRFSHHSQFSFSADTELVRNLELAYVSAVLPRVIFNGI